jgi:hypothetical protein
MDSMTQPDLKSPLLAGPLAAGPILAGLCALVAMLLSTAAAEAVMLGATAPVELHDGLPLTAGRVDCDATNSFTWDLTDLAAADAVSFWGSASSADCSIATNRSGADATCFELRDAVSTSNTTVEVTVTVPELTNAVPEITGCVDSSGTNVVHTVGLYFLVNASGDVDAADVATVDLTLDFVGPAEPTLNSLGPSGSDQLSATWSPPNGEGSLKFRLYCAEATDQSEEADCAGTGLVQGEVPTTTPCDDGAIDGAAGTVIGRVQGTRYAVGVAGLDDLDNPGVMSNILCAVPAPVDGFNDRLEQGGGIDNFCTVGEALGVRERGGWALGLVAALGLWFARRRRGGRA